MLGRCIRHRRLRQHGVDNVFHSLLFFILVIMLNLLIVHMSDTFERVMESWVSWVFEGRRKRIETIIEQERLMGGSQNDGYFPKFLQVVRRPVEETSDEWAEVSGQISTSKAEEVKREADSWSKRSMQWQRRWRRRSAH
jgi:hypothetical protein